MSRKAKRYFGTGYQVRIKVAVSLNRVSRWMETWQRRAILMTIFSIRLRAASFAGPWSDDKSFLDCGAGLRSCVCSCGPTGYNGDGRSAWRTETAVMHGGPRACVGSGGCVAIRSPYQPNRSRSHGSTDTHSCKVAWSCQLGQTRCTKRRAGRTSRRPATLDREFRGLSKSRASIQEGAFQLRSRSKNLTS